MKRALIIGGGVGGAVAAIELAKKGGWHVLIVDRAKRIGSGLRTMFVAGHPCTFGPRHFLSHSAETFDYFNEIVPMRLCAEHQYFSFVSEEQQFFNYPIHWDDIPRMSMADRITKELNDLDLSYRDREYRLTHGAKLPENQVDNYRDFWLASVGPTLYSMFIEKYTRKMWRVEDETVIDDFTWSPKGVAIKRGPREGWDNAISAYPRDLSGYDPLFEKAEKVAQIRGGCRDVKILPDTTTAMIDGETHTFDIVINTAPLDDIFDSRFGPLAYVGRRLEYLVLPVENALPKNVYFCYYTSDEPYTRCVEYKKFTRYQSASTLISLEYPSADGKYYPLPVSAEKYRHQEYINLQHPNMRSIGRLGLYNYRFDIDDAVEQAREAVDILG